MTETVNLNVNVNVNANVITIVNDVTVIGPFGVTVNGVLHLDVVTVHHQHVESALQQVEEIEIAVGSTVLSVGIIHAHSLNRKVNHSLDQSQAAKVHHLLNQVHLRLSLIVVLNQKVIRHLNLEVEVEVRVNLGVEVIVRVVAHHQAKVKARVKAVVEVGVQVIVQKETIHLPKSQPIDTRT